MNSLGPFLCFADREEDGLRRRSCASGVLRMKEKMKIVRRSNLTVILSRGLGILILLVCSSATPAQTAYPDKKGDCRQCHALQVNDIAVAGGGHRGVPCSGCHDGHPPEVKKPIAPCHNCHLKPRNSHFEITTPGCLDCHTNPHRPLNISLKGAGKDTCLICHGPEIWMLKKYESKHTALECSNCHDVHRKIPQCTQCHKPHNGRIVGNCNPCHQHAHRPKIEAFPAEVPSTDCGSCHKVVADLFGATTSKHNKLSCIDCHQMKHRFKPDCQDCHGTPHPEGILAKFPECVMCHYSPHDLNNWPETATKVAAEAPKKR